MIQKLFEDIEKILEFGQRAERQEREFVKLANEYFKKIGSFTLIAGNVKIQDCIGVKKIEGKIGGYEPYTDVVIQTKNKSFNVSMKGPSAPSLAGGGLEGMEKILPGNIKKYLEKAESELKRKYKKGDNIPDIIFPVPKNDLIKFVAGTKNMGGPIDYMYIGPMNVSAIQRNNNVTFNGNLSTIKEFTQSHSLFIRLRKRRNDQLFEPGLKDKRGYPAIFGRSPSKGDINRRIVMTDKPSSASLKLNI